MLNHDSSFQCSYYPLCVIVCAVICQPWCNKILKPRRNNMPKEFFFAQLPILFFLEGNSSQLHSCKPEALSSTNTVYIYTFSLQLQFAPYSQNHCSGSAMECSSFEAICNESEMIAHLQSLFWSSSDADPCFGSSSFSLISSEGYDTMTSEFVNSSTNVCFDYQDDSFVSAVETTIGNKRKVQMDTENELMMNRSKEVRTKMLVRA